MLPMRRPATPWFRAAVITTLLVAASCDSTPLRPPPDLTVRSLGAVHVEGGRLVDEWGRELVLRGANVKTEILFDVTFADGRTPTEVVPPWDPWDAPELAARGFDLVRLCISWSGLEPAEGAFAPAFLARLDQVVDDLEAAGVYVLIDFHQDAWSKEIGEDGAPLWATVPAPPALLPGPIAGGPGLDGPYHSLDARRTSAVTLDAFTSFFENRDRLQERFMPAWRLVAARYAGRAHVIGFENMNEPVAAHVDDGVARLYAFHDESIRQLRAVNTGHPVWIEPEVFLQNFLFRGDPRTTPPVDDNLVWAPHLYPRFDDDVDTFDEYYQALRSPIAKMVRSAASWQAATVIGEWWARLGHPVATEYVDALHALADELHVGLAVWNWKGYRNPGAYEGDAEGGVGLLYDWDYRVGDWYLNRPGFESLARPYALAVPGHIERQHFDRRTHTFEVDFTARGHEGPPLLYIPDHRFPGGYEVTVDGRVVAIARDPATSRALVPWPGLAGRHLIQIRAAAAR